MDTEAGRRRAHISIVSNPLAELYPHDCSMYDFSPENKIRLSEFEEITIERLQLLRIIEQAGLKGYKIYTEDWKNCIKEDLSRAGLKKYIRLMSGYCGSTDLDYQARRDDHISHYILRVAYCRSDEKKRWFLNREIDWFRLRFSSLTSQQIKHFLDLNKMVYNPIMIGEKNEIKEKLLSSTSNLRVANFDKCNFYLVPFKEVCALVRARRVFLKRGMAYVPTNDLAVCVISKFRAKLSAELDIYSKRAAHFHDDRVNPLLSNLHSTHTGKNYIPMKNKQRLDVASIDAYSKQHFPLCMEHMHGVLRTTHHLRHGARLQYGLFLKGIGLLYEDAVNFWKDEFLKEMDSSKFDKEHLYNIKHLYGKAGNMTDYSPQSCLKIIMGSVGAGDQHGCPFKHWDSVALKQKWNEKGVPSQCVNEMMELVKNGHYQIACGKYYQAVHKGQPPLVGINHPNQYVEESVNLQNSQMNNI